MTARPTLAIAMARIELLLPSYGASLGLKGRIATHWALNPHPTLIPAIESGWVEQVHSFGSEVSMQGYIRARPDIFFTGRDGSLLSNRALFQVAGLYACDLVIGATLKIWLEDMPNGPLLRKQGIARAAAFLSSNAASDINGHLLMVDAGYSIS